MIIFVLRDYIFVQMVSGRVSTETDNEPIIGRLKNF